MLYVLLAQTRWDRKLYARPIKTKDTYHARQAMAAILAELPEKPKEVVFDAGGEFTGEDFQDLLAQHKITARPKGGKGEGRATRQNLAQVDSAMAKYSLILKKHAEGGGQQGVDSLCPAGRR